jgi:two-component sensor histidine kinase
VHIAALAIFLLVCGCLVLIAEGLHRALEAAHFAQRAADLLLQEMSHRVKNKFAMISSIIALQARQSTPDVRAALEDVAGRVNVIATVHSYLQLSRQEGLIDMGAYLSGLCQSLEKAIGMPRAVALTATSAEVKLPPEKALSVGVIVNELVTNAIKYAFEDERPGRVVVELGQDGGQLVLSVTDNGKGCDQAGTGLGTKLVTVFATQLGGGASWQRSDDGGCRAVMRFPV